MDSNGTRFTQTPSDPSVATRSNQSAKSTRAKRDSQKLPQAAPVARSAIGARVRDARASADLSQVQLASKAGLGNLTLSCWERGDKVPSLHSLRLVAQALEYPMADLLDPHGTGARSDGVPTRLGDNLRAAREAAGLTQAALAARMGAASSKSIERWETENIEPTIAVLERLAQTLNVSVRQLVLGSADAPPEAGQPAPMALAVENRGGQTKQEVAARLVAERTTRGLTPEDFAAKIGVSPAVLARWEQGRGLDLDGLARCARCLGLSTDSLLGLGDPIPPLARRLAKAITEQRMPSAYLATIETLVSTATA